MPESSIQIPITDDNEGPLKHTRTRTNADGDETHEDVVQVVDMRESREILMSMENLLARQVFLLEAAFPRVGSTKKITTRDVT